MASIEERLIQTGIKEDGSPLFKQSYRVKVRLKGQPAQSATFERKTDAKHWAQDTEAAIRQGRYFKDHEAKRHTLSELIDRYIVEILPQKAPRTQIAQMVQLKWWKSTLGHLVLADITPSILSEAKAELSKAELRNNEMKVRAPATVVRYFAAISHVFTVAIREWYWTENNPVEKVQKPKLNNSRTRFLSTEEREALLSACLKSENPCLHLVVLVALSTGARKNEIMTLKWRDVDLSDRPRITLRETKNGETRAIPLSPPVAVALHAHAKIRRLDTQFVFPGIDGKRPYDIRSAWETAVKRAGLENFRFHDLRHSCASYIAMSGGTTHEIMAVLGHKSAQMAKRYAHIGEQHTSGVLDRMAEKFLEVER